MRAIVMSLLVVALALAATPAAAVLPPSGFPVGVSKVALLCDDGDTQADVALTERSVILPSGIIFTERTVTLLPSDDVVYQDTVIRTPKKTVPPRPLDLQDYCPDAA